jgi:hypothetical protein
MYTDKAEITADSVLFILYASKKYMVSTLTTECTAFLERELVADNACSILDHSSFFQQEDLIEKSMWTIQKDAKKAFESDAFTKMSSGSLNRIVNVDIMNAEEVDLFQACLRWAHAECQRKDLKVEPPALRNVLEDYFKDIRFPAMSLDQFTNYVVPHEVLSSDEGFALFRYFTCPQKPASLPFKTAQRENPFAEKQTLLYTGQTETRSIMSSYTLQTISETMTCHLSKSAMITGFLFHAFTNTDSYHIINMTVKIIQDDKTIFDGKKNSSSATYSSKTCYVICPTQCLSEGTFTIIYSLKLQSNKSSSGYFRKHNIIHGKTEEDVILMDKYLTVSIEKVDRLPLWGIEYTLV